MKLGVYAILNITNDKFYIGSAKDFRRRFSEHIRVLKRNKHPNRYLQFAFNKHELNPFIFVPLEECCVTNLIEREQFYIDTLKPEYNLAPKAGSNLGFKHSDEAKRKISEWSKTKTLSKEHKAALIKSVKGNPVSIKTRLLMSINRKKRITKNSTRLKIAISLDGNQYRRDLENWPCVDGYKCNCEICYKRKRDYANNWRKEKRRKQRQREVDATL